MVYQLCRPVYARWMDAAVLSGALALPGYEANRARLLAADWLPTKWDWVDPLKDANAEITQIEAGLKSRTQAIAERGYDAEQVDREIAAERARERALGLDFRRPGSPVQGVQAVPGPGEAGDEDEDTDQTDQTDDAEERPREPEDQS
jgi:capsid protein